MDEESRFYNIKQILDRNIQNQKALQIRLEIMITALRNVPEYIYDEDADGYYCPFCDMPDYLEHSNNCIRNILPEIFLTKEEEKK